MRLSRLTVLSLAMPFALACSNTTEPTEVALEDEKFAASLGIDLPSMTKLASGMYIKDLVVGTGAVVVGGATISVLYTGWLANGSVFDGNAGGAAVEFPLNNLIEGWKLGLPGVKVGGKRRLVIPSSLGYGPGGSPPVIPAYANLVFDVEVTRVR
jgi:FKBP-type peptidyl-prolyl cis-trans isomerase FkpA